MDKPYLLQVLVEAGRIHFKYLKPRALIIRHIFTLHRRLISANYISYSYIGLKCLYLMEHLLNFKFILAYLKLNP